jgi:sulfate/thiosulfate transport system permease protein
VATAAPGVPLFRTRRRRGRLGTGLGVGVVVAYLSVFVLLPMAAVAWRSLDDGTASFWAAVTTDQARAALTLSLALSAIVTVINVVTGTAIAWTLTRDRFPGRSVVNALIDLPFALPTIVAGLTLLVLYGPGSPLGVDVAYTRYAIALALAFVTLPFVIRAVQPLLESLDREMEEAAASLGAGRWAIFRRIILPNLAPGIIAGAGLGFAKAMGEFGSVVLISGNIPFKTETASVHVFGLIESDQPASAAAVSVVLLGLSLAVLLIFALIERRVGRHQR